MTSEGIQPESFRPEESLANQDCLQFSTTSLYKKVMWCMCISTSEYPITL